MTEAASAKNGSAVREWVLLGLGIAVILLAFSPPATYSVDGNSMLDVAMSLVTEGNFTVPGDSFGAIEHNGDYYGSWYPLLSIIAVPLVAAGLGTAQLLGLPQRYLANAFAVPLSSLITAITAVIIALLVMRLGGNKRTAVLSAIAYSFGTMALAYTGEFFAEPLVALLSTSAVYYSLGDKRRDAWLVAVFCILAPLAKPAGIVVGPMLTLYYALDRRSRSDIVKPLAGAALGIGVFLIYNYMRFGVATQFGFDRPPMSLRFVPEALLGYAVSPGRSLALFCPPTVVTVAFTRPWRSHRSKLQAIALMGVAAGHVLGHASFADWHGAEWCWGPRYLLPAVPLLIAMVAFARKDLSRWIIGLSVLGFLVNAPTLVSYPDRYISELRVSGTLNLRQLVWSPTHSQVIHQWGAATRTIADARETDVKSLMRSAGKNGGGEEILRIVPVWWWMLPIAGIPIWAGIVICLMMVALGYLVLRSAIAQASTWDRRRNYLISAGSALQSID